jgi:ubiquinone/menaquinone biosynthesis C-methylase UbiE
MSGQHLDVEKAVTDRYSAGARKPEPALCCAVTYDSGLLRAIPPEIRDRDYGCGDPTPHVRAGDTVLDLGCGAGKLCYIAAQQAGPAGRVIGVDMNDEMLDLARKHRAGFAVDTGLDNLEFHKARIQDLRLDLERADRRLRDHPVATMDDMAEFENLCARWAAEDPVVPDASVDLILSNCVLNLVRRDDRSRLFEEMYRILKVGGRVAISDIVTDEPVPAALQRDPELWSGCISGAFREEEFLEAFRNAGFHGMRIDDWNEKPFAVVEGIEFRSITVTARKGKAGPCIDGRHAVVYRGPWSSVEDDDGHRLERGVRVAVCEKTFRLFRQSPYAGEIVPIEPRGSGDEPEQPFDCNTPHRRDPRQTKGLAYRLTRKPDGNGGNPSCC